MKLEDAVFLYASTLINNMKKGYKQVNENEDAKGLSSRERL